MENFYGKKNDLNKMARILDQVKSGGSGAVLVSGPAGSGKTALVNRFAIKAEKQGALFCFAKADPLFFNTPFSTLARALNMLVKKAIGENPHDLKGMKKAFLKNFSRNPGPGLGTLLNLVPALSHLLGTKPNQTRDSGTRGGQSLNSRLLCLVESFASLGRPLILFLDDLQWMDPASHNFLTFLAINGPVPGFMPVLAFRSPNKENTEILEPTVTLYQKKEDTLSITLSGLTKRDTRGFLKQRLATFQNLNPLADICHEKTAGNPFYLIQLVDELLEKKAISQKNREWIYDLPLIAGLGFTDNIIELLIQRMQLLEKNSLALLKQAACIQSNITIALLKASSGFSEKKYRSCCGNPFT